MTPGMNPVAGLLDIIKELPQYKKIQATLIGAAGPASIFGLLQIHKAHLFASLTKDTGGLMITTNEQSAKTLYELASAFSPGVIHLPAREIPLVNAYAASESGQRVAALTAMCSGEPVSVIASVEAAMQALAPKEELFAARHELKVGDIVAPKELYKKLFDAGYETLELVEEPGQAALRGCILDVFPPNEPLPVRIEFFGDEIDRLSSFDVQTQRSVDYLKKVTILPATEAPQNEAAIKRALKATEGAKGFSSQRAAYKEGRPAYGAQSLLPVLYKKLGDITDYMGKDKPIFLDEPQSIDEYGRAVERLFYESLKAMLDRQEGLAAQEKLQLSFDELLKRLDTGKLFLLSNLQCEYERIKTNQSIHIKADKPLHYQSDFSELAKDLNALKAEGERVIIFAGDDYERVHDSLLERNCITAKKSDSCAVPNRGEVFITPYSLASSFSYPEIALTVLCSAQIISERITMKKSEKKSEGLVFSELEIGDYIVHEANGIGKFMGVEKLCVQGFTRDYLLIEYADKDKLYIPTDQLDRVQKYLGGVLEPPLSRLGSGQWQSQVQRAKAAVMELAIDLANLYTQRETTRGFAFSPDTPWQKELELRFPYTETKDQLTGIEQVKRDMESPRIMDRLLLGDVGYGKTEVALRAAFKAVQDGKQAAFLVPTTILAQQHYNTLTARYEGFPVNVGLLSRFRSYSELRKTKRAIKEGRVDVVVGTHALLSKDVCFKDLGLLIIDEEQRFGVSHKETIKALKQNVDVLTLTATPIPRTLHMSLIGIRDMSVIDTPPKSRFPVQTYVLEYSDALMKDALTKELGRGGQCYVVHNFVKRLEPLKQSIQSLIPDARIAVAHGQLPERELEGIMIDFIAGKYDILVCSTIIENGLDIKNANTLFVLDADKMGLAQLYQLRGRIGRSQRQGYSYFTFLHDKLLSEVSSQRLAALAEFAQFGAGRQIALRDLQIRGAGSFLGARQHGHIADIGYEYYSKLIAQAIDRVRGGKQRTPAFDTVLDIPIDSGIPKHYIKEQTHRLSMYKRIAMIRDIDMLMDVKDELYDRYGDIPEQTENLLETALIKSMCSFAGVSNLSVSTGGAKLTFHAQAKLDGAKLLSAVVAHGAKLLPTEPMGISLIKKDASVKQMLDYLRPFVEELRMAGIESGVNDVY